MALTDDLEVSTEVVSEFTYAGLHSSSMARPAHRAGPSDLLLDGLATLIVEGRVAAAPMLRRAVSGFRGENVPVEQLLQWGILASSAAVTLWDFESWNAVSNRQIELARAAGALGPLSIAPNGQGMIATWSGEFEAAASLSAEDDALKEATGTRIAPYGAMLLAAYQGRTDQAITLIKTTIDNALAGGEGVGVTLARWTTAVLNNSLGRYGDALAAAQIASEQNPGFFISDWALPEPIEGPVERGQGGRGSVPRGARAPRPYAAASRARPRPPSLR